MPAQLQLRGEARGKRQVLLRQVLLTAGGSEEVREREREREMEILSLYEVREIQQKYICSHNHNTRTLFLHPMLSRTHMIYIV